MREHCSRICTDFLAHKMLFPLQVYPLTTANNDSRCLGLLQPPSEMAVYLFGVTSSSVFWKGEEVLSCSSQTIFCAKIGHDITLVWIKAVQNDLDGVRVSSESVSFNSQVVFCSVRVTKNENAFFSLFWVARSDGSIVNTQELTKFNGEDIESLFTCVLSNNNIAASILSNGSSLAILDPNLNVQNKKDISSFRTGVITCSDEGFLVEGQTDSKSFLLFFDSDLEPSTVRHHVELPRKGVFSVQQANTGTILIAMITADNLLTLFAIDNAEYCPSITESIKVQVRNRVNNTPLRPSLDVSRNASMHILSTRVRTSDGKNLVSEGGTPAVEYVYVSSPLRKECINEDILLPTPIPETANGATISKNGVMFICGECNQTLQIARVL
jgi:hypothetical protein